MFNFFKRRFKNETGAMDSILVTLLLIVVGLGVVATLASWMTSQTTALKNDLNSSVHKMILE